MTAKDLFPTKLVLFSLGFLIIIFSFLFYINTKSNYIFTRIFDADIPALQVYCGASRIIAINETLADTPQNASNLKINQLAISYALGELDAIGEFKQKPLIHNFLKNVDQGNVPISKAELGAIKNELQDFIETYLDEKNRKIEEQLKISTLIISFGMAGMVLFLGLMFWIYRLYQKNVTELESVSARLEEQRINAMQVSKMASLGEMVAGLAHEINNPLAVIIGKAEIALSRPENMSEEESHNKTTLLKIMEMSNRIAKIVNSMRRVARGSSNVENSVLKVNDVVDDVLNLCQEKLKKFEIELIKEIPTDSIVIGDFNYVSQILINLIGNAIDEISVLDDRKIWIKFEKNQTNGIIKISDSGKGIPKDVREKIFQPFYTRKEVGKGTGLGLSISQNLAQEMGGELTILDSATTTFILQLRLPTGYKDILS